jgi:cephalosporin hydroxylase
MERTVQIAGVITIDEESGTVTVDRDGKHQAFGIGTPDGFRVVSDAWLRAGWDAKHVYTFSWLGRPIIQLPEDMFRIQELVFSVKPDVIVETGIAHGGSLVFYASLCHAIGRGRVVGVDVEIRPPNRAALKAHPLRHLLTLIEADSTSTEAVRRVREECHGASAVLVVLDSAHTYDHVLAELEAYSPFVTVGSYVVVMDGSIMALVAGGPRTGGDWTTNNPAAAAAAFAADHPDFELVQPPMTFNESSLSRGVSYFGGGLLRRNR